MTLPESLDVRTREAIAAAAMSIGLNDSLLFAPKPAESTADSASSTEEEEEPSWDIDVMSYATHDRVSHYVSLFTGPAKERIQSRLQRGKRYEPMIREKFRARGIPEDMYYLGLVESGYDPHAYSRAAAVGMWQFMSSTARGVGLRVDHWVDERRDPIRATDAAAKFLNILHNQFGSYYLAAAAYNGGPGRVSRGLARFQDELRESEGDDKFFTLAEQSYLRSETRNYVPQLIAAALIGKTPGRYGLSIADSVEGFTYDSVRVPELTSLGMVARASQSTVDEIRDLNPHFLRGATPPRFNAFVRVPSGKASAFDSLFLAIAPDERVSFARVRSKKGQTLSSIARANGLDTRQLAWYNPGLSTSRKLAVGKEVLVPANHVIVGARDVPDPRIERYGTSSGGGRVVHVVRRGESLGLIAKRYRTSVASLKRVNGLKRTVVYPGQTIIVRAGRGRSRPAAKRASTTTANGSGEVRTTPAKKKPAPR
ncbi:MAG: transglycosylase SLT domain-containing protein [Gemmatimonadaceae bacterium]